MTIFKACDIRGVVGEEWTTHDARRIGGSLATMLGRRGRSAICVGGDLRRSTGPLKVALIEGLVASGARVYDLGQLPTPAAYFGARHIACDSVAIVTASHNPGRYNGIKFMVGGWPAVPELVAELRAGLDAASDSDAVGSVKPCMLGPAYEQFVVQQSRAMWVADATSPDSSDARRRIRVALDTMGGTCTSVAPRVLKSAGYAATCVSPDIDPDFSHRAPNPANDANLGPLIRSLQAARADVGIALDGDGDRVVFLDEAARIVRPEQIAAVLVQYGVPRPTVVYDLKCASLVSRAVQAAGGTAVMRPRTGTASLACTSSPFITRYHRP